MDVPDLADLADRLNGIQPCEYDDGMSRASLVVTCPAGPLVVRLTGEDGDLVQPPGGAPCRR